MGNSGLEVINPDIIDRLHQSMRIYGKRVTRQHSGIMESGKLWTVFLSNTEPAAMSIQFRWPVFIVDDYCNRTFCCRIKEGCATFRRMFRLFRNCVIGQWQITTAVPDQECFILDLCASGHSFKFQNVFWKNTSYRRVKYFQIAAVLPWSLRFTKFCKLKYMFLNRIGIGLSNRKTDVFRSSGNFKCLKFIHRQ
jgi:hypothetical protein